MKFVFQIILVFAICTCLLMWIASAEGQYITLNSATTVTTKTPVSIADCNNVTSCALLPGTYYVRGASSSNVPTAATTTSGSNVTWTSSNTDTLALAASNTYIKNYRQGTEAIGGFTPGQSVPVVMQRINFDFGAGTNDGELGNNTLAARFAANFNALTTRGGVYWPEMEKTQGKVSFYTLDTDAKYAAAHGMHMRIHNVMWDDGDAQAWVDALQAKAAKGDSKSKTALLTALHNRVSYLEGDKTVLPGVVTGIDVLNEGSSNNGNGTYYQAIGTAGIASVYAQANSLRPDIATYVNNDHLLNGRYTAAYIADVKSIDASGGSVKALGIEDYNWPAVSGVEKVISPSLFMTNIQQLNTLGRPETITEFGAFKTTKSPDVLLSQALTMMFGNSQSTGFFIWEWVNNTSSGWAPYAGLYDSKGNLTNCGKVWQDLVLNQWRTPNQTVVADANGVIHFNGFYGDYLVNGKKVTFSKSSVSTLVANAVSEPNSRLEILSAVCVAILYCVLHYRVCEN